VAKSLVCSAKDAGDKIHVSQSATVKILVIEDERKQSSFRLR
jgi:hypothetical protein